jgi:flagellar biosynthesis anti-sigma factor FlgM
MSIDSISKDAKIVPLPMASARKQTNGGPVNPRKGDDDVRISEASHEFLRIRRLVDALPDVRLDRVNHLAKSIDQGTYNISGERIAEAIIDKHLIDFKG